MLLQRLRPSRDIHQRIYVTDNHHRLVGFISLEDLVLHKPSDRISEFMQKNEFVAYPEEDQEQVVKKMVHYGLMAIPVVNKDNIFLGVISGETLVDVLMQEASEDVQRMAALTPMKYPYFETSFLRLLWERGYILALLLLVESFSSTILHAYESSLSEFLILFIPMLLSVGGNTSSQTSAMVIQGMASGDIDTNNIWPFVRRELAMATLLGIVLGTTSFIRVQLTGGAFLESLTISAVLAMIVMLAALLGSGIPILLKRLNLDPAFSAGPFLATLMDIFGVLIFCLLTKLILFS
jgi:magnesium transporter